MNLPRTLALLSMLAVPCFGASSSAVNMSLAGVGAGHVMAGVYTSPYSGTVNNSPTAIICDAFADETFLNETWQASVSTVADLGATKWGGKSAQQRYDAAAALSLKLMATSDATQMGVLSFAIWDIFDPSDVQSWLAGQNSSSIYAIAHTAAEDALSKTYTAGQFSNVSVYTLVRGTATGCPGGPCPTNSPQEFLSVTAPEPSAAALLGIYLSSLVALVIVFRRRLVIR